MSKAQEQWISTTFEKGDVTQKEGSVMSPNTLAVWEKISPMDSELASVIEGDAPASHAFRKFFSRVLMEQDLRDEKKRDYENGSLRMSDVALLTYRWNKYGFNPNALKNLPEEKVAEAVGLVEKIMRTPSKDENHAELLIKELDTLCEGTDA